MKATATLNLTAADLAAFNRPRIDQELLGEAEIGRVTDREARDAGIMRGQSARLEGILFPYMRVTGEIVGHRLRRDNPEVDQYGKDKNKYISSFGDRRHFYLLKSDRDYMQDTSVDAVFVEAEKSKLALTALSRRANRPFFVIGLGGSNGYTGKIGITTNANGERVDQKGPISDFDHIAWSGRKVTICLDTNVETNPHVQAAETALRSELTRRGATVRLARIPQEDGVNGPDDYIANHDDGAMLRIIDSAGEKFLRVVDAAGLLTVEFPPRAYVLNPIIQTQSLSLLYSFRGIGKTFLGMSIGAAVAAGGRILKWSAPSPRKVLYVDGEMPGVSMQARLSSIVAGMDADLEPGYFRIITPDLQPKGLSFPILSGTVGQKMIEDELDGSELLIIDNLSCLTRGIENEAESWVPLQEWVLSLRRQGVSVLFLHHAGKAGAQRGTSKREDVLDTVITLKRPEDYQPSEGSKFEVHFEKCRGMYGDAVEPFEAQLVTTPTGAATWVMSNLENIMASKAANLFESGMSVRDVADELKISKSKAQRLKGGKS